MNNNGSDKNEWDRYGSSEVFENEDELYEIECNYMEEKELCYPSEEEFLAAQRRPNAICHEYFGGDEPLFEIRCSQSAPGQLNYESHSICSKESLSQPDLHLNSRCRFIDCTDDCGSDELEGLLNSADFQTVVLYANYNTRNMDGLKEHYSSDAESEILEFVNENSKLKRKKLTVCSQLESASGYELTKHEGVVVTKENCLDPNLGGFGQSHIMRPIMTLEEQKMLGIAPNLETISRKSLSFTNSNRRQLGIRTKIYEQQYTHCKHVKRSSREASIESFKKHNGVLRIDSIKIVPCDDPAAAGDSFQNNNPDRETKMKVHQQDMNDRVIISATHNFKQSVLLHLPHQPQFALDKLPTVENSKCFDGITLERNINSKPLLSVSNKHINRSKEPMLFMPAPSLPSVDLRRCINVPQLNNDHLKYQPPKFTTKFLSPSFIPRPFSPSLRLCQATSTKTDFKLSPRLKAGCAKLWPHHLNYPAKCYPSLLEHSQSEIKFNKLDRTVPKKVQFTYTSHESFFNSASISYNEPLKQFKFNCLELSSLPGSWSSSKSTTLYKGCPGSDSQEILQIITSPKDISSAESASTSDSSTSSFHFSHITPTKTQSTTDTMNSSDTWVMCPAGDSYTKKIDSTSYTILQSTTSRTRVTSSPQGSSDESLQTSLTTFSDVTGTTLSGYETPPRKCMSTDSDSDYDDYCGEVKMTDKMAFKFMLDENGSEVEISVTLPFPIPCAQLPIESPFMAAAVLQKAQELVLQNIGSCMDEDNDFFTSRKTSEWVEHITKPRLPALECSISLEELLLPSTTQVSHTHSKPNTLANGGEISVKGSRDKESPNENVTGCDYASGIISFLSYLFWCICCRRQLKVSPDNSNKCQQIKRNK